MIFRLDLFIYLFFLLLFFLLLKLSGSGVFPVFGDGLYIYLFFFGSQVFEITTLQIFSPLELDNLLCGRREMWMVFDIRIHKLFAQPYLVQLTPIFMALQAESLVDHIKFDHGYTAKSPAITNVLIFQAIILSPQFTRFEVFS